MAQKSLFGEKIEYLLYGSTKRAPFLSRIELGSHSKSIRIRLVRTFVKYHCWPQQENLTFSQIGKENNVLNKTSH